MKTQLIIILKKILIIFSLIIPLILGIFVNPAIATEMSNCPQYKTDNRLDPVARNLTAVGIKITGKLFEEVQRRADITPTLTLKIPSDSSDTACDWTCVFPENGANVCTIPSGVSGDCVKDFIAACDDTEGGLSSEPDGGIACAED